jgi:hypothetical protein
METKMIMKLTSVFAWLCVMVASGCSSPVQPTQLSAIIQYEVSPCSESTPPDMENIVVFTPTGEGIQFEQDVKYVCCAEIVLTLEQDGDTLKVIETNQGKVCKCECGYHVSATIPVFPANTTRLEVWGVQYPEVHPLELLGEYSIP